MDGGVGRAVAVSLDEPENPDCPLGRWRSILPACFNEQVQGPEVVFTGRREREEQVKQLFSSLAHVAFDHVRCPTVKLLRGFEQLLLDQGYELDHVQLIDTRQARAGFPSNRSNEVSLHPSTVHPTRMTEHLGGVYESAHDRDKLR